MALVSSPLQNLTVQNGTGVIVPPAVSVPPPGIPQPRVYAAPPARRAAPIEPIDVQRTPMVPMAAALKDSKPGGPASAMMLGFTRAGSAQQEIDAELAAKAAEEEKQAALRQQAAALIREQYPDQEILARGVEIGAWDPESAMAKAAETVQASSASAAAQGEAAEIDAYLRNNGRDDLADQYAAGVLDVDGIAEALAPTGGRDAPANYRYKDDGTLEPIPGGPADKSSVGPRELSAGEKKELFDAQDAVVAGQYVVNSLERALELSDKAREGFGAETLATVGANIPDIGIFNGDETDHATIELKNITTEMALNQLKTVFGGMPTEGERKILLELQGSASQPKPVRDEIYNRALEMARRRIADQQAKAASIQTGDYLRPPGQDAVPPAITGGDVFVPEGVDPADWEFMTDEQRALFQ